MANLQHQQNQLDESELRLTSIQKEISLRGDFGHEDLNGQVNNSKNSDLDLNFGNNNGKCQPILYNPIKVS